MTADAHRAWRGRGFGLNLEGDFPIPGLEADSWSTPGRRTTIRRRAQVAGGGTVVADASVAGAPFVVTRAPSGYVIDHGHFGRFAVAHDGSAVDCAPAELPHWQWHRFLIGQVLPLAALLRGLEPYHASAVALGDLAYLCLGPSGSGKTSVALELVALGATFMADDVVATEPAGTGVHAYAGPGQASVAEADLVSLENRGLPRWTRLGVIGKEVRLLVTARQRGPLEVGGTYVLGARSESARVVIRSVDSGRAPLLLGSSFNAYIGDEQRALSQLAVAERLARLPLSMVEAPAGATAAEVAEAIVDHMGRA
jgi:hypothetical protein